MRPYFFSGPVQAVVGQGNRVLSHFLFDRQAKDRLRELFSRLPVEFSSVLIPQTDRFFEACRKGRGIGPGSYLKIARWLSAPIDTQGPPIPSGPRPPRRKDPKRLRLLFVAGCAPTPLHGGGLRLLDLLDLLSAKHEVSLYAFHDPKDGPIDTSGLGALRAVKFCSEPEAFVTQLAPWLADKFSDHAEFGFDAIHVPWPRSAELMPTLRAHTPRLIFEFVECVTRSAALSLCSDTGKGPASARAVFHFLEAFYAEALGTRLADQTVSVIPQDAVFSSHVFNRPLGAVIPTCLSERHLWQKIKAGPAPANQDALFLGFFGHPPNMDALAWYLQEVHPRVARALPRYRLVVSGSGAADRVRALIGNTPQVVYRGAFDDLAAEVAACRIGLAPLISGSGIRGKVNQYAALERPTVTTSIGALGLPYVANQSILLADSPGEFAERIIRLMGDEALYESMRQKAHAVAEAHFRWGAQLGALETLYRA